MMIKIGSLYIYVTRYRMKRRSARDDIYRNRRKKINRIKKRLYKDQNGECAHCGTRFPIEELEAHHIKPMAQFPRLVTRQSNIELLCHNCHLSLHGKKEN